MVERHNFAGAIGWVLKTDNHTYVGDIVDSRMLCTIGVNFSNQIRGIESWKTYYMGNSGYEDCILFKC